MNENDRILERMCGAPAVSDPFARFDPRNPNVKQGNDNGGIGATEIMRQALREIRALAHGEQSSPTGLHMTCLSIIERTADEALYPEHVHHD